MYRNLVPLPLAQIIDAERNVMSTPLIPRTYDEWKHCITVSCGIPLTLEFVEQRLRALSNPKDFTTQKYRQVWGDAQLEQVRIWFQTAQRELQ